MVRGVTSGESQQGQGAISTTCQWLGRKVQEICPSSIMPEKGWQGIAGRTQIIAVFILVAAAVAVNFIVRKIWSSNPPDKDKGKLPDAQPLELEALKKESDRVVAAPVEELASPVASEVSPPSFEELTESCFNVAQKLEVVLSNLKDIRGATGAQFLNAFEQFQEKFGAWENNPAYETHFSELRGYKWCFDGLLELKQSLFISDFRIGKDGIVRVPRDGNCLFHTVGRGLRLLEEEKDFSGLKDQPLDHESLRKRVVEWERNHLQSDPELRQYIDDAIEALVAVRERDYTEQRAFLKFSSEEGNNVDGAMRALEEEEKELQLFQSSDPDSRYNAYLAKVEQNKFFASSSEIYALSRIYPKIAFHTHREIDKKHIEGFDPSFNEGEPYSITIVNVDSNHFDLYIPRRES